MYASAHAFENFCKELNIKPQDIHAEIKAIYITICYGSMFTQRHNAWWSDIKKDILLLLNF